MGTTHLLRACHVGDLHFWRFTANPLLLAGKRVLGIGNLALHRARRFRLELAPVLVARLAELRADAYLFSGDFSTTSLAGEFEDARAALAPVVATGATCLGVPGNHDRYTPAEFRNRRFEDGLPFLANSREPFPCLRALGGGVWVAALDSTAWNGLNSFGVAKAGDVEALRAWRAGAGAGATALWVLCHHPAEEPRLPQLEHRRDELRGGPELAAALRDLGLPVLFLHGHHHYRWLWAPPGTTGLTYLNGGAPLMRPKGGGAPDLGFHELRHEGGATEVVTHRWTRGGGWVAEKAEVLAAD